MGAITFLFVDQSSSRRLEKIGEDIFSGPEVIGAHTLILGKNLNFCNYFFGGGRVDPVLVGVYVNKTWSVCNACENLRGQQPLRAEM